MPQVVGLPTLMAWDADVATAALARLTAAALQLLAAAGGYPAAAEGGELLAAFRSAVSHKQRCDGGLTNDAVMWRGL